VKTEGVVVDASPLIVLASAHMLDLLPRLFRQISIPEAVWQEIMVGGQADAAVQELSVGQWFRRVPVPDIPRDLAAWDLGAGEAQVLALARESAGDRAMVDDDAARACAQALGIPLLGTGAALILAKRRGLISSVAPALDRLRASGLWLSAQVEQLLLEQAGEAPGA
jgi:predicted nucleic acid-binding protein